MVYQHSEASEKSIASPKQKSIALVETLAQKFLDPVQLLLDAFSSTLLPVKTCKAVEKRHCLVGWDKYG